MRGDHYECRERLYLSNGHTYNRYSNSNHQCVIDGAYDWIRGLGHTAG